MRKDISQQPPNVKFLLDRAADINWLTDINRLILSLTII